METGFMNRIIGLVLALVVGGLLVGGLLIPSIEGMTATEKTFENEGYYTMDSIGIDATKSMIWTNTNPMEIVIDSDTVDLSPLPIGRSYTLVGADNFVIRFDKTSNSTAIIQGFGSSNDEYFNVGNGTEVTITINAGTVACHTNREDIPGGVTTTYTYTDSVYTINPDGTGNYSYVMKDAAKPAYVKGDSQIHFIGVSNVTPTAVIAVYGEGTLNDGMTLETAGTRNITSVDSYSEPVATYTTVNGYVGLYSLDKYEFTITYDTSSTYDATYTYFVVPASVTAELSQHLDATQIAMFGVISILGIVALVVVAANGIRNKY